MTQATTIQVVCVRVCGDGGDPSFFLLFHCRTILTLSPPHLRIGEEAGSFRCGSHHGRGAAHGESVVLVPAQPQSCGQHECTTRNTIACWGTSARGCALVSLEHLPPSHTSQVHSPHLCMSSSCSVHTLSAHCTSCAVAGRVPREQTSRSTVWPSHSRVSMENARRRGRSRPSAARHDTNRLDSFHA